MGISRSDLHVGIVATTSTFYNLIVNKYYAYRAFGTEFISRPSVEEKSSTIATPKENSALLHNFDVSKPKTMQGLSGNFFPDLSTPKTFRSPSLNSLGSGSETIEGLARQPTRNKRLWWSKIVGNPGKWRKPDREMETKTKKPAVQFLA